MRLIERTYEGTLDCTALNGVRDMEDVINGYQATGVFRPENWLFVRGEGEDVGVLLLADHPQGAALGADVHGAGAGSARARLGQANYAVCAVVGARRGVERIACGGGRGELAGGGNVSQHAGFEMWDQRAVYLRFPTKSHE